jgi:esterase/lipase superfamily enzyme
MELLIFGNAGTPALVFPTSQGRFFDYEDRGMVESLRGVVEQGRYRLCCVDSVDAESWYNEHAHPRERVMRHLQYEQYIVSEVIPLMNGNNHSGHLLVTGCSFGGFHSVNFSLRHPDLVDACISLSGAFDVRQFLGGYYDQDCYFNNPVDYLPNLTDEWYLDRYRSKVKFVLATGEWDICLDANLTLSRLLESKGVQHYLDVWGNQTQHDWPWWQMMIRKFLA